MTTITLIDDNSLFRAGVRTALASSGKIKIISEFDCTGDMIKALESGDQIPGIAIISSNNLIINNNRALKTLKLSAYSFIKVFVLLNRIDEFTTGKMIHDGIDGYVPKNVSEQQLKRVIAKFSQTGIYKPRVESILTKKRKDYRYWDIVPAYSRFLSFCATDMTYRDMADIMEVSPRTIEGYRDNLYFAPAQRRLDTLFNVLYQLTEAEAEIVATLYAVWNNRIIESRPASNEELIADFYEWSDRKQRYSKSQIESGLQFLKKNQIQPRGFGQLLKRAKSKN